MKKLKSLAPPCRPCFSGWHENLLHDLHNFFGGLSWQAQLPHPQEGIAEKGKLGQFEVFGLDVIVDADQRVYLLALWLVTQPVATCGSWVNNQETTTSSWWF